MDVGGSEREPRDADARRTSVPARLVRLIRNGGSPETLVIAKIGFDLRPGTSPLSASPEPLVLESTAYDAFSNSLRRIQDIAPPKPRSDVLVVGFAYAPGATHDSPYEARIRVGAIDKTLVLQPPSFLERDGSVTIEPGPKETRLCHELAREDETTNPFGTEGLAPGDAGRLPLPRIEASNDGTDSADPPGFGPVPLFPEGELRPLGRSPHAGFELRWDGETDDLQAAPRDQQLEGSIPPGVTIELVNLHPTNPVLTTRLESVRLLAHIPGWAPIPLAADTLVVDTEQAVCLLTFRASLGDASVDVRAEPRIELLRGATMALIPQVTAEFDAVDLAEHSFDTPFSRRGKSPGEETVELERRELPPPPVSVPGSPVAPPPPASMNMTGPFPMAPPSSSLGMTGPFPAAPQPPTSAASRPARVFDEPTYLARAEVSATSAVTGPASEAVPAARGALAASNEAAGAVEAAPVEAWLSARRVPRDVQRAPAPPETLELLWFAPDVAAELKSPAGRGSLLEDAFPAHAVSDEFASPVWEPARDVRRALLFAKSLPAPQGEVALSERDKKTGVYRSRLQLVVGELVAMFDPKRQLEATIGTVESLLPSDKSLRAMIDAAKKLLESEWVTPPPLDLAAQNLREAAARSRDPNAGMVDSTIERLLLERRAYRVRPVLGGEHVRFGWFDEGRPAVPIYLPMEVRDRLPLFPRLRARALVDVHPRQDAFEAHPASLRLRALARRLEG